MTASVLIVEEGRCLVLEERDDQGMKKFNLPGGHAELAETPMMTAVRETKEETGYDVEIGDLLTIQVLTWEHHTTAKYIFYGKRTGGTLMTEPGTTVHWMGKEEIKAKAKEEWIRNMNEVLLLGLEGYKIDARAAMFYENGERIIRRARVPFFLPIKMPKNRST